MKECLTAYKIKLEAIETQSIRRVEVTSLETYHLLL